MAYRPLISASQKLLVARISSYSAFSLRPLDFGPTILPHDALYHLFLEMLLVFVHSSFYDVPLFVHIPLYNKKQRRDYLLYNPSNLNMEVKDKSEVISVYEDTCWCATHYHFEEMFGQIVDFLAPRLAPKANIEQLQALKASFTFDLCDQDSYHTYF